MFKNAKALDKQRHRDLTYTPVQGYNFAGYPDVTSSAIWKDFNMRFAGDNHAIV